MLVMGLINYWRDEDMALVRATSRMENSETWSNDDGEVGPRKLKLVQFKGLFILSCCGLSVAALAVMMEIAIKIHISASIRYI